MQIKITRTWGEIGAVSTPAKMHIRQAPPKLKIKQRPAEMVIEKEMPKLVIDQDEAFADMNNKTMSRFMRDIIQLAYEKSSEAIGKTAKNSTRITKAGKARGDVIRQIIIEKSLHDTKEINIAALPRSKPVVRWERGHFRISWKTYPPEVEWEINARPEIYVEPHSVKIYMRKYPALKIDIAESKKKGTAVNRKI
jgi:hypothetical protein